MIKLAALNIVVFALRIFIIALRVINFTVKVVLFAVKIIVFTPVFIVAFAISMVARLIGFLAYTLIDGLTQGYTVTKGEMSIGARINRRMKKDLGELEGEDSMITTACGKATLERLKEKEA